MLQTGLRTLLLVGALLFALQAAPAFAAETAGDLELSPEQAAAVSAAERYLNDLKSFTARFVQVATNGGFAEGEVLVQRPGKLRFEYDPPTPILIIANGLSLLYYDKELKQASFIPLWETPLWFLVGEDIRLDDKLRVTEVVEELGTVSITVEDRENADAGKVTLVFSAQPMALKRWRLLDAQGVETQVTLVNPRFGVPIDSDVFDYSDLEVQSGTIGAGSER